MDLKRLARFVLLLLALSLAGATPSHAGGEIGNGTPVLGGETGNG